MILRVLIGLACTLVSAASPAEVEFTPAEREAIAHHGPWPPPLKKDSSNRYSGKPAAIAFGRKLFFDARISLEGKLSCASCHLPSRAWADAQTRSFGRELLDRNAPSIANTRFERWFGRDGSADSLWSHAIRPLTDPREMAMTPALLADRLREHKDLGLGYRRTFGAPGDDEDIMVNLAKALAAFQETVVTGRTPFDDFRDASLSGDA